VKKPGIGLAASLRSTWRLSQRRVLPANEGWAGRRERAPQRALPARAPLRKGVAVEQREPDHARIGRGGGHGVLRARAHAHDHELADAQRLFEQVHAGLQVAHGARGQVVGRGRRVAVADAAQVQAQAPHAARGQRMRQLDVDAARPDAVVGAHVEHEAGDGGGCLAGGRGDHADQRVVRAEAHRLLRHAGGVRHLDDLRRLQELGRLDGLRHLAGLRHVTGLRREDDPRRVIHEAPPEDG
jgi:hypothetical protein